MSEIDDLIGIPNQRGKAARVINPHGNQVTNAWAFNAEERYECMAMEAMPMSATIAAPC